MWYYRIRNKERRQLAWQLELLASQFHLAPTDRCIRHHSGPNMHLATCIETTLNSSFYIVIIYEYMRNHMQRIFMATPIWDVCSFRKNPFILQRSPFIRILTGRVMNLREVKPMQDLPEVMNYRCKICHKLTLAAWYFNDMRPNYTNRLLDMSNDYRAHTSWLYL